MTETQARELHDAVREMRRLQRAWFGGDKTEATLVAAKRSEKRVDRLLAELEGAQGRLV